MTDAHRRRCVVLGCGGHARMVIAGLRQTEDAEVAAILDADRELWGTEILGIPILGGDDRLAELAADGFASFAVGVGAIGDAAPRRRLFELGLETGLEAESVRYPSAVIAFTASLGAGCQLFPGAIVNEGAMIGANAIVNSGAIVEHDGVVGDHAHVAPGAVMGGGVVVGTGAHVGIGATVREGIRIGDGAMIAAGAVVIRDVAPGETVKGVPAA